MSANDCEINTVYEISRYGAKWVQVKLLFVGQYRFVCARKDGARYGREEMYDIDGIKFRSI